MSNIKSRVASPPTGTSRKDSDNLIPILLHPHDLRDLPNALRTHGAAYISNPPLPQAPLVTARSHLFSLPQATKDTLKHANGSTVRGYSAHLPSGREWWDYTPETNVKNRLLPDSQVFVKETEQYFQDAIHYMYSLVDVLRETWAEIPKEASTQGLSTVRYLRYAPALIQSNSSNDKPTQSITQDNNINNKASDAHEPSKASNTKWWKKGKRDSIDKDAQPTVPATTEQSLNPSRMQTHTDHGILTLMTSTPLPSTNPVPNLYIYTPNEQPLPAPPIPNTILIIAGDCLAHWTDCDIVPTAHEVVVTEGERVSCAVFLRPGNDAVLCRKVVERPARREGEEREKETVGEGDHCNDDPTSREKAMTYKEWAEGKGVVKGRRCWLPRREAMEKKDGLIEKQMQQNGSMTKET